MTTDWPGLVKDSFLRPRRAAGEVRGWPFDAATYMQLGGLAIAISTMVSTLFTSPGEGINPYGPLLELPLLLAALQFAAMLAMAGLAVSIGRWFGGRGTFRESLGLMAWYQVASTILLVLQAGLALVLPPLGVLLFFYALIWFFWAITAFVAELHGFENPWAVFGGVFVTLVVILFMLALAAAILGVQPEGTT